MIKYLKNILISLLTILLIVSIYTILKNKQINKQKKYTKIISNEDTQISIDIEKIISDLCSNEFNNRAVGYQTNDLATKYLNNLFENLNLEFVFNDSYLHKFNISINEFNNKTKQDEEIQLKANNIIGKINNTKNKNAIIITAHFDAFGKGSLDNASGVGTVIKIIDILKSKNNTFNNDILFCMTNGEMNRFVGSRALVNDLKTKYSNLYNINIDCIGLKNGGPLALKNISKVKDSNKLYESAKNSFKNDNIEFLNVVSSEKLQYALNNGTGVSDYMAFEEKKFPNIHIAQSNLNSLPQQENLGEEILDFKYINNLANAISNWIVKLDKIIS